MGSRRVTRAAVLLAAAALLAGCTHDPAPTTAKAPPTPIAKLNTAAMRLARVEFCSRVPAGAVKDALGSAKWRPAAYHNGDRTGINGITDTVAEDGCAWAATTGTALARAWVFAPPVDRRLARSIVAEARHHDGCRLVRGPAFGDPSLTQVCRDSDGIRVRHAGLFDTTWLSCEVSDSAPARAVRARADAWCVQIANALNTSR